MTLKVSCDVEKSIGKAQLFTLSHEMNSTWDQASTKGYRKKKLLKLLLHIAHAYVTYSCSV